MPSQPWEDLESELMFTLWGRTAPGSSFPVVGPGRQYRAIQAQSRAPPGGRESCGARQPSASGPASQHRVRRQAGELGRNQEQPPCSPGIPRAATGPGRVTQAHWVDSSAIHMAMTVQSRRAHLTQLAGSFPQCSHVSSMNQRGEREGRTRGDARGRKEVRDRE